MSRLKKLINFFNVATVDLQFLIILKIELAFCNKIRALHT